MTHHETPFPYDHATRAFSDAQCAELEALFSQTEAWQHRDAAFYRCSLADVSGRVPAAFQAGVLERMRTITGLPLANRVVVTAQRMLPGQAIGTHSDRPLLGYEIARLVVHLNRQWKPEYGGVLELFATLEGEAVVRLHSGYNEAFGFVLHAASYHGVTEVTRPRRTVVFNFWHAANTPELAAHVETLFANGHFSALPAALDPVATAAEASLPEEATFLAGTAALALHRWGYDAATVVAGYQHCAGRVACRTQDAETRAAVLLADWVARLYRDSFDLARWEALRRELDAMAVPARLKSTWALCLARASVVE